MNLNRLKVFIESLQVPLKVATEIRNADFILTVQSKAGPKAKVKQLSKSHNIPLHIISSQENQDIRKFLKTYFKLNISDDMIEEEAVKEATVACKKVLNESRFVELSPREGFLRRLQHEIAHEFGLNSMSVGEDQNRRLRIYPRM